MADLGDLSDDIAVEFAIAQDSEGRAFQGPYFMLYLENVMCRLMRHFEKRGELRKAEF